VTKKKLILGLLLAALPLIFVACSGEKTGSNQPVKATWVEPEITGDTVTLPVSALEDNEIIHFKLAGLNGDIAFMGYEIDGETNIRANLCPPCRSIGFSLNGDTLVCDTCRTQFEAKSGEGISGACVAYPKAEVAYKVSQGKIVMNAEDLLAATSKTAEPGWP
jgi:nitrite reductase/ring-hydroxylating ferredoxin subunit